MKNVAFDVKDNTLTIKVDLKQDFGLSKSGKTKVVASTEGFAKIDGADGVSLNLNVNKKWRQKE
jgi:hypothetical protein